MHKRISILCVVLILIALNLSAQTTATIDTSWKKGGVGALNFNQISFTNWAAGGENSISGSAFVSLFANFANGKKSWDNQLDLAYGLTKSGTARLRKNEDKIELNSKLGYKIDDSKFFYTFLFNLKSQFADGYTKPEDSVPISKFAAPAYVLYSLGIDFKPNESFSVYVSPITGKTLIISDQDIADAGTYGNEPLRVENSQIIHGKKTFTQIGAFIRSTFKKDIMTNVNFQTKLELFSNYQKNPQNIAINWEILVAMKVNKYITANIGTQLIYDDIVAVPVIKEVNGVKEVTSGHRVQFKEAFGIGLSYKF